MKITMYELLGLVKDGKAPKKIKYKNIIYELNDNKIWADEVYSEEGNGYIRLSFKYIKSFNDEVEILEEEKKIPEKIDIRTDDTNMEYIKGKTYGKNYSKSAIELAHTINEIIDYLKSKGE